MRSSFSTWIGGLLAVTAIACGPSQRPTEHAETLHAVDGVYDAYDPAAAHRVVAFADRYFRVRGNLGYRSTLEHVRTAWTACGITNVSLREHGPEQVSWTPRSGHVSLVVEGQRDDPVISFATEHDRDRATLLVGSDPFPTANLEVIREEAVRAGESARGRVVLANGAPSERFAELVQSTGAVGLLVRNLEPYHQAETQLDAAQFGYLPAHATPTFGFSLSERAWRRLRAATETGVARIEIAVDVELGVGRAGFVEAILEGDDPSAGDLVFVAHVDEPGANDNASGVGALTELACTLARLDAPRRRGFVFLIGQEMEVSERWLAETERAIGAGLVLDMVGQDPEVVGAPFLIERMPDPAAIWLRAPDRHTEWGAGEIAESALRGHFLNDLLLASAARVAERAPGFRFTSNPYEGGSDHVSFLTAGFPSVLGWHFTDPAYHTTLDRLDRVSAEEMRRVSAVFGGAATWMASDDPAVGRAVLGIVSAAARQRLGWARDAAAEGSDPALEAHVIEAWIRWYEQALQSVGAWWPAVAEDARRERDEFGSQAR